MVIARLDRAIQYAAPYRFKHCCLRNTGCPAFCGHDSGKHNEHIPGQTTAFSRRISPELCFIRVPSQDQRAQGMPGEGLTRGPPAKK